MDPIIVELGPVRVTWYGLMYVLGFLLSYLIVRYRVRKKDFGISLAEVENLYFYLILGLIIGARLGYAIFYDPWVILFPAAGNLRGVARRDVFSRRRRRRGPGRNPFLPQVS